MLKRAPATVAPARGRGWRAARALGWCLVFVLSTLLGLLLHGNAPALRRTTAQAIQRSLDGNFRGQLVLGEIERLSATRLALSRLELREPGGAPVLSLERVQVSYGLWQVLGVLLGMDQPLQLQHIRVERSRVTLSADPETGRWSLERALQSPRPPGKTKPKRPAMRIALPAIELGELELQVQHPSVGRVQASVHHLRASAELAGAESRIDVQRFGLRLQAPRGLTVSGTGSLRVEPHGFIASTFHGFADGTELDLAATFEQPAQAAGGQPPAQLSLRLEVPRAQAQQLRRRFPGWPLESDVSARLSASGALEALQVEAELSALSSRIQARGEVSLAPARSARLDLVAQDIDARLFSAEAPET